MMSWGCELATDFRPKQAMPPNAPVGDGHYRCRYDQGSRNFAEISEIEKPPFLKTDLLSECVRDPLLRIVDEGCRQALAQFTLRRSTLPQ